MNSKEIGNVTEQQCITGLYEQGCDISIPFGNSQKYDLIMDYNGKLYKVQVKHANVKADDAISVKTRWQSHNSNGYKYTSYTKDDVDFFATYYNGIVYLIPIEECCSTEKILRLISAKNNQKTGINLASDYAAEEVLKRI